MNTDVKSKLCHSRTEAVNWINEQYGKYPDNSILSSWTDTWSGSTNFTIVAYIIVDTDIPGKPKIKI